MTWQQFLLELVGDSLPLYQAPRVRNTTERWHMLAVRIWALHHVGIITDQVYYRNADSGSDPCCLNFIREVANTLGVPEGSRQTMRRKMQEHLLNHGNFALDHEEWCILQNAKKIRKTFF